MKIGYIALTFICLIAILCLPNPVRAQNQLNVITNSADIRFPMAIDFRLHASNYVQVNDVRLRYTIAAITLAKVTSESYVKLVPSTDVNVEWTMDMRRTGGLPPGTKITYWWVLTDKDGKTMQTDPIVMQFDDGRYRWRNVTSGQVTIFWYSGGDQFAKELLEIANNSIKKMGGETGLTLEYPINIYLYASYDDLKGAMVFPPDWIGAASYEDLQTVIIGVPAWNTEYSKTALKHELNHQVTRQLTNNPYCDIPVWLNEGLAVYAEGDSSYTRIGTLKEPTDKNTLVSIRSLSSPFSTESDLARQEYAESYSIVDCLISTYGQGKMLELLAAFKKGSTCDEALKKVYNLDMDGLNTLWRKYLYTIVG
jgi:hypothetical protein